MVPLYLDDHDDRGGLVFLADREDLLPLAGLGDLFPLAGREGLVVLGDLSRIPIMLIIVNTLQQDLR